LGLGQGAKVKREKKIGLAAACPRRFGRRLSLAALDAEGMRAAAAGGRPRSTRGPAALTGVADSGTETQKAPA